MYLPIGVSVRTPVPSDCLTVEVCPDSHIPSLSLMLTTPLASAVRA